MKGKDMSNEDIKELIKKYLGEDDYLKVDNQMILINHNMTAYISAGIKNSEITYEIIYEQTSTNCVIVIDAELVLFEANNRWYRGTFVGENNTWIRREAYVDNNNKFVKNDIIEKIILSGRLMDDIENKTHIHGVSGVEDYDTLEELLINF